MKRLEAIVHPLVGEERRQFVAKHRDLGHSLVVLDIPLLYETKAEGSVDGVCVVSAPPEV
jgi:dephospho-CoA kinase